MSVINFDTEELANVLQVVARRHTGRGSEQWIRRDAENLATISRANAKCFAYRYQVEQGNASTAEEILAAAANPDNARRISLSTMRAPIDLGRGDVDRALSTVTLIRYNCAEDVDFLEEEPGGFKALCEIQDGMLRLSGDMRLSGTRK